MKNVNDLGYGKCPGCKEWKHLTLYHPKDHKLKRREKNKYCEKCIREIKNARTPFYELKKAISGHRTIAGEGDYSFKDLMTLHKQQGSRCAYCGESIPYSASIDHIIPKKFEGRNLLSNIILTCLSCNAAKQHFELFYFLQRKGYKLTEFNIKRIRKAYDFHGYECKASCKTCKGNDKPKNNPRCEACEINPERYTPGKIQAVQESTTPPVRTGHNSV